VRYSSRERHLAWLALLMAVAVVVLLALYLMPGSSGPPQLADQPKAAPPKPVGSPQAKASASPTRTIKADYNVRGKWKDGFNAELTITNLSSEPVEGWTVQLQMPPGVSVLNAWSAVATQKATAVTLRSQAWNTYLAPGGSLRMGFQATGSAEVPRSCTVNGSPC
jgi:cellulase/cellobiase CelA1